MSFSPFCHIQFFMVDYKHPPFVLLVMLHLGTILQDCKIPHRSYADDTQIFFAHNTAHIDLLGQCLEQVKK